MRKKKGKTIAAHKLQKQREKLVDTVLFGVSSCTQSIRGVSALNWYSQDADHENCLGPIGTEISEGTGWEPLTY